VPGKIHTDPNYVPPPMQVGFRLPEIILEDLEGQKVPLSSFRGKVVLLNLFTTWCDPCKDEMPELAKIAEKLADQEFVLLGVGTESAEVLRMTAIQYDLNYPILRDVGRPLRKALGTDTIPRTVILDRDGTVVAHHRGYDGDIQPVYRDLKKLGLALAGPGPSSGTPPKAENP
jgi:peroxiredoxin